MSTAIDPFRMVAAFLIVAIHTAPLSSFSATADFLFSYCLGRIAVPFFLMTTGYFVLAPIIYGQDPSGGIRSKNQPDAPRVFRQSYWTKTTLLYLAATILYLPINIYSGKLPALKELFKVIVFDGTFYHLWYLPAALLGMLLLVLLAKVCPPRILFWICMILYLMGLLGDSWYGLIENLKPVKVFYDGIFTVSSYTRNGIFYAPVFLFMGAQLSRIRTHKHLETAMVYLTAALVFLALMLGEGYLTFTQGWQRHNSMYLFLIPCMFFLFRFLLSLPGKSSPSLRKITLLIYLLHPFVIILVRGFAKATHLSSYLVENSLLHYFSVCAGSLAIALCLTYIQDKMLRRQRLKIYSINIR